MRTHNVGLMLASAVQIAGMRAILRSIQGVSTQVIDPAQALSDSDDYFGKLSLSAIVVDPILAHLCPDDIRQIALLNGQYPPEVLRDFTETISIYDTEEEIRRKLTANLAEPDVDSRGNDLSPREKDVILAIVKGKSNKEIAEEMHVSVNTVMTHRRNIATKLQIHSPAGLTIFAIATRMVKIDDVKDSIYI